MSTCTLIKNNKLVKLTVCSSYLYPLVQVLCSMLYLTNHTIYLTPIANCILSLYLLLSCLLYHVQASSRCARPKYALHAPSYSKRHNVVICITATVGSVLVYSGWTDPAGTCTHTCMMHTHTHMHTRTHTHPCSCYQPSWVWSQANI